MEHRLDILPCGPTRTGRFLFGGALTACALMASAAMARPVSETPPDASSPRAVMTWAMDLDRTGWDYLGSADDAIYFVRPPARLPNGHLKVTLRAEFYNHAQVGKISSSLAEFEIDCRAFALRRLSNKMLAGHNLQGDVLSADAKPGDWLTPPGVLIPAAVTGACLAQ